jgi:hypothetical protein
MVHQRLCCYPVSVALWRAAHLYRSAGWASLHQSNQKEREMKTVGIMIACCLGCNTLGFAGTATNRVGSINATESQDVTESLRKTLQVRVPDHLRQENPTKNGTEFNLGDVFQVLKRLSMEEGWQPDYDYHFDGMGGCPVVYARGPNGKRDDFLAHVRADSTTDGFFQLALLALMHDQFYLWWHAGYKQVTPIVSADDMKWLPDEVTAKLKSHDLAPTVVQKPDGEVVVNICTFSEWDGVARVPIRMQASFPHSPKPQKDGITVLAPYDCGILF